jgi:hypothetical protein
VHNLAEIHVIAPVEVVGETRTERTGWRFRGGGVLRGFARKTERRDVHVRFPRGDARRAPPLARGGPTLLF